MRDPNRLEVLERARELTELTYAATATLPASEARNLVDQMRRAATSVGSNIAEGCGRSTDPAYLNFLQQAVSSADEVEYQAGVVLRLGLGEKRAFRKVLSMAQRVRMMLARLIASVRKRMDD